SRCNMLRLLPHPTAPATHESIDPSPPTVRLLLPASDVLSSPRAAPSIAPVLSSDQFVGSNRNFLLCSNRNLSLCRNSRNFRLGARHIGEWICRFLFL